MDPTNWLRHGHMIQDWATEIMGIGLRIFLERFKERHFNLHALEGMSITIQGSTWKENLSDNEAHMKEI